MLKEFAEQVANDLQQQLNQFSNSSPESASRLKAIIESAVAKLNLVTREEFDAQQKVLLHTRERLELLEKEVGRLETLIGSQQR